MKMLLCAAIFVLYIGCAFENTSRVQDLPYQDSIMYYQPYYQPLQFQYPVVNNTVVINKTVNKTVIKKNPTSIKPKVVNRTNTQKAK